MNAPTNLPAARRELPPLVQLNQELEKRHDSYRMALPSHIKPEDLQRTVVMAAQQNPKLLEADRRTLMLSCMKAAQDGLLPDGREAALVPFSTRKKDDQGRWFSALEVQYMPMVYGLRKKILQSEEISTMAVGVVYHAEYDSGRFLFELGIEPPIRHKPDLLLPAEEVTDDKIVAAYSLVKFKDGSFSGEVMRRSEIDKIRELSQTGATKDRNGKPRESKGPWADHFAEMAKKTVMRRHSKVLPMSGDIFRDVEGAEQENAVRSAVQTLDSVDEAAPLALPSQDDEQVDETTGEIIEQGGETQDQDEQRETARDPATGMTEVDEETARALDAGQDSIEEPEEEAEPEEGDSDPKAAFLASMRRNIPVSETTAMVKSWEKEWLKNRVAYSDEEQAEVDGLIATQLRAVRKEGGK